MGMGDDAKHEPRNTNKYDVFLNFSDRDTGHTFTGNLFNALRRKRIKTFFKEHVELHKSDDDPVPPSTLETIKQSRISIVVLSQNYASSVYCLDELVAILECMKINNKLVWPVYYKVEPWEFRRKDGDVMYAIEQRFGHDSDRVLKWMKALFQVTNLNGWMYQTGYENEYEFIRKIVESAVESLPHSHYDVFLSFSGEDTRYSFTGFLYNAFRQAGFKTFMDDEGLVSGNQISQDLIRAIKKSRLSIVVFSENYGYSTWCLDELANIMECMKTNNQKVWPIFYKVEKSHICNQTESYGLAMTAHEERLGKDKVQKWRSALSQIANFEGEHVRENEYEYELIERIVKKAIDIDEKEYTKSLLE